MMQCSFWAKKLHWQKFEIDLKKEEVLVCLIVRNEQYMAQEFILDNIYESSQTLKFW